MRWIVISGLAALVGVAMIGLSSAGESEAPKPADIAEWIRSGKPKDLDRAVKAAESLGVEQLRQVIIEVRDQTQVNAVLQKKRVKGLVWEEVSLDTAVSYLQTITGLNYYVTPKARAEKFDDVQINVHLEDVSVRDVLSIITEPFGLTARVRQRVVHIGTAEEFAPQAADAPVADSKAVALRKRIAATNVNLSMKEAGVPEAIKTLQIQTGFNIVIDPRVAQDLANATASNLVLTDVALSTVLNMLAAQANDERITWTVKGNVILFTSKEFLDENK